MKLQHIAAAVALVATGAANAAIATGGNGSMVMIGYDKAGGTTTAGVFDLGLLFDDMVGATGNGTAVAAGTLESSYIQWNFNTNTITIGDTVTSAYGNNDWTAAWNTLLANSDAQDLSFVVTAFDTVGFGAAKRTLATGVLTPTAQQLNNNTTHAASIQQPANSNDIFTPIANRGTIASADNGAYTFTAADGIASRANGYAMAGDGFANEWRNNNLLKGETLADVQTGLWILDGLAKERLLGTLDLDVANGTLTYNIALAPAVPEPSTYALVIAGLAIAGAAARRKKA